MRSNDVVASLAVSGLSENSSRAVLGVSGTALAAGSE